MSNEISVIIKAVDKASADLKKVQGSATSMATAIKGAGIAAGLAATAVAAAVTAYKQLLDPVIKYNKAILDASRSTGMSTEALSRFVQVGDDVGVSMGSITTALEMATKRGFAPSIEALASLADKANGMATSTERAALLAETFGRGWAELNPILTLGGDAIRDIAAAQADGLVVTEEEIRQTEKLRLRIDEFNDSLVALRNTIMMSVLTAYDEEAAAMQEAAINAGYRKLAYQQLVDDGINPTTAAVSGLAGELERIDRLTEIATQKDEDLIVTLGNLGGAYEELSLAQQTAAAVTATIAGDFAEADRIMGIVDALQKEEDLRTKIADQLAAGISPLTAFQQIAQSDVAGAKRAAVSPVLAPPDLTAWDAALTEIEATQFPNLKKAVEAGITRPIDDAFRVLRSMDQRTITTKWDKYETTYKRTVRLDGGLPYGFQHGADFVVPPGYPNDSFPMAVSSGEHVVVTPNTTDNSRSININSLNVSSEADRVRFDKQMRDWLGA